MDSSEMPSRRSENAPAQTADEIRRELGDLLSRLQALPADAFAERDDLRRLQDALRKRLRDLDDDNAARIRQRWAERAGAKPGEPDPTVIPSPGESGGEAWS